MSEAQCRELFFSRRDVLFFEYVVLIIEQDEEASDFAIILLHGRLTLVAFD